MLVLLQCDFQRAYEISCLSRECCLECKCSGNIQKKEDRPDRSVSNNKFSSVTLNELAMKSQDK